MDSGRKEAAQADGLMNKSEMSGKMLNETTEVFRKRLFMTLTEAYKTGWDIRSLIGVIC